MMKWFDIGPPSHSKENVYYHSEILHILHTQNMCKEFMFGVLDNNLPLSLSLNRDKLE